MCLDSTSKITSTDFWKRAVTTCGKSHIHYLVHYSDKMGNHPLLIKCALKTHGKPNPLLFERGQGQHVETISTAKWNSSDNMEICPLLIECDVRTHEKKTSIVVWNRAVTTCEKLIHCLVKQQKQHVEIHQQLIKCDVATHGKQYPLFFESE